MRHGSPRSLPRSRVVQGRRRRPAQHRLRSRGRKASGTEWDAGRLPSIDQGAAAGRHAQEHGPARSRGPVGIVSGQHPDRPAGPAFARAICGHRGFPSWAMASPGVELRTNSPPTVANARPAQVLLRIAWAVDRHRFRVASGTARSPVLDRSPSKWHHSLQCASQLSEQLPIVSLHYLVCWRQPRRPASRLSPSVIPRAINIFDFELVFANRHMLNLIRKQSCFRQTSSVSSGS